MHVVLLEPEIPPNTGNVARLCAATGSWLHLVGPLGFRLTDAQLRRAGLDYWDAVQCARHADFAEAVSALPGARCLFFSTRGTTPYTAVTYQPGDALVFGSESRGLPDALLDQNSSQVFRIPLRTDCVRSLNLATAVGIVLYEALRQIDRRA